MDDTKMGQLRISEGHADLATLTKLRKRGYSIEIETSYSVTGTPGQQYRLTPGELEAFVKQLEALDRSPKGSF